MTDYRKPHAYSPPLVRRLQNHLAFDSTNMGVHAIAIMEEAITALSALEKERDELAARLVSNSEYHMREKATLRAENAKLRGGWEEATIAWAVCASLHREYCKGKDPFYKTRQADFLKHETDARAALVQSEGK